MSKSTGEKIRLGDRHLIPQYIENVEKNVAIKPKKNPSDEVALRRAEKLRQELSPKN